MPCCVAVGCSTREFDKSAEPPITFHFFPTDPDERKKWTNAVRREKWEPSKTSRLCSKHFKPEDFDRSPFYTKFKKGVVPSIFDAFPDYLKLEKPKERRALKRHKLPSRKSRSPSKKKLKIMLQNKESALNEVEAELKLKNESLVATNCRP